MDDKEPRDVENPPSEGLTESNIGTHAHDEHLLLIPQPSTHSRDPLVRPLAMLESERDLCRLPARERFKIADIC